MTTTGRFTAWVQKRVARWLASRGWEVYEVVTDSYGLPLARVRIRPDGIVLSSDIDQFQRALVHEGVGGFSFLPSGPDEYELTDGDKWPGLG